METEPSTPAHPVRGEVRAERFRFVCERGHQSVGSDPAYRVCTAALWEKPGGVLGPWCGADIEAAIVPIEVWNAHALAAAEVEQLKVRVRLLETMCDAAALLVGDRPWREMIDIALTEHGAEGTG